VLVLVLVLVLVAELAASPGSAGFAVSAAGAGQ
jgi:hypothetical protein